ncbi:MAG TPA: glycosyl transferase [Solibacterales bacterium]|nr:glycosyl transferase [Bryobacterales bacterium]
MPTHGLLSILIPVYNEEEFLPAIVARVLAAPLPAGLEREVIICDDGSNDGSGQVAEELAASDTRVRVLRHPRNRGKGAAVRTALGVARGEFSLIQDADLEYDPNQYDRLLRPLLDGRADVVYGSRFVVAGERRVLYYWHAVANQWLTSFCNIAANLNLTDPGTCYKAFRTSFLASIPLSCDGFSFEVEATLKLAKREARIYETPVSYHGRTYDDGKKIRFGDALAMFAAVPRFWLSTNIYKETGPEILDAFTNARDFNRWMADTIRPYVGERVLEIGAGIGNLTRELIRGRGRRYVASDYDGEHLARLQSRLQHRPNLETRRLDLTQDADFADLQSAVDTVVCLNVVEHIEDDLAALRRIRSTLVPGGHAVILVPEGQAIFGKLDEALGHFRRYSKPQLQARMEEAGFTVERILEFNRISRPGWYVTGRLLGRSTLSPLTLRLFNQGVWLWRRIDRLLPWKPTSIIAIGRNTA